VKGNDHNPEENIQHSEHGESLKLRSWSLSKIIPICTVSKT